MNAKQINVELVFANCCALLFSLESECCKRLVVGKFKHHFCLLHNFIPTFSWVTEESVFQNILRWMPWSWWLINGYRHMERLVALYPLFDPTFRTAYVHRPTKCIERRKYVVMCLAMVCQKSYFYTFPKIFNIVVAASSPYNYLEILENTR